MATVWKKKGAPKEIKVFNERSKIESHVFDRQTLLIISKLMSQGMIESLDYAIKSGKEAYVFRATGGKLYPNKYLAVKIYMLETRDFTNRDEYIANDPRFNIKGNKRKLIYEWAKKEYSNLLFLERNKIKVPHPHIVKKNVLVMDFIGDEEGNPAPTLKEHGPYSATDVDYFIKVIDKMYNQGFVHADLSEYNVLCAGNNEYYIIDLSQGVLKNSAMFEKWYNRDLYNIKKYFSKF
jgi:RIO kinase 1